MEGGPRRIIYDNLPGNYVQDVFNIQFDRQNNRYVGRIARDERTHSHCMVFADSESGPFHVWGSWVKMQKSRALHIDNYTPQQGDILVRRNPEDSSFPYIINRFMSWGYGENMLSSEHALQVDVRNYVIVAQNEHVTAYRFKSPLK